MTVVFLSAKNAELHAPGVMNSKHTKVKVKATKEIATLKNNIYELEKVIEHLNGELTTMHQQYEEVDPDYKQEKKLCRKFQEMCERARPKSRKKRYK